VWETPPTTSSLSFIFDAILHVYTMNFYEIICTKVPQHFSDTGVGGGLSHTLLGSLHCLMMLNAIFNNISV